MFVFYNEIDPFAASWLRELVSDGQIPFGVVDERDIRDIHSGDLDGYDQCHFFAGIGGWAYALALAGQSDLKCWTGSCPCQPFSAAGRGGGFADERHLWPAFFHLIGECRPASVFGEQVASPAGLAWLDLVRADLEGAGYAVGAADLCAASVGAPHIRQRLWWVAHASDDRRDIECREFGEQASSRQWRHQSDNRCQPFTMGPTGAARLEGRDAGAMGHEREAAKRAGSGDGALAYADGRNTGAEGLQRGGQYGQRAQDGGLEPWSDVEWLHCRDGKARPTQRGLQPLAHGIPNRVGTLRGAGNAIVPQVAAEFIKACT